jgi:Spy/CpxP family protein refolding chaperone
MKKGSVMMVTLTMVCLLMAPALWAGQCCKGFGQGPGNFGAVLKDLSKEQQAQINSLRIDFMKKQQEHRTQMGQKRIEMAELTAAGKIDEATIQKKREEMWALQDAMIKERRQFGTQLRSVLTPEQREKLGPLGGGMGGGFGCGLGGCGRGCKGGQGGPMFGRADI